MLTLQGRLDLAAASRLWRPAVRAAGRARGPVAIVVAEVTQADPAGVALLAALLAPRAPRPPPELRGADPDLARRLKEAAIAPPAPPAAPPPAQPLHALADRVAFLGEAAIAAAGLPRHRRLLRGTNLSAIADGAGTQALPLVLLLGFLIGVILAFQAAIPLARFGAQLFVANLVVIALLRELGPLLAAVILAGRTGSAFAAELGSMAINEELAALRTMGIDPVGSLVLPRLLAAVLVMPALTLAFEASGLLGMAAVLRGLGFPLAAVYAQARGAAHIGDLLGGLLKAVSFGALVAFVGCRAGIAAGAGPRAVGQAATAAVVGGIVGSIVLDGVFAVVFYRLGL